MTTARTPLWVSIASALRQDITEGKYEPGSKLPTEANLAERFGVNRHTIRHSIAQLVEEGLVHARRGAGVFVLTKPLDYPLSDRVRFHQNLSAAGRLPNKKQLLVESRSASEGDTRRLSLDTGDPVAVAYSLSFADDTPVALAESRFPEARLPDIAEHLRNEQGITKALMRAGVEDYVRVSTRITAVLADATQALHLRIREGTPLLLTESISKDTSGTPVEHGRTWFVSERVTLTLDHQGS